MLDALEQAIRAQERPKCTDISRYLEQKPDAVAATLSNSLRKPLSWTTPAEVLGKLLSQVKKPRAATTP